MSSAEMAQTCGVTLAFACPSMLEKIGAGIGPPMLAALGPLGKDTW